MQHVVIDVRRLDGGTLRVRHAMEMAQVFFTLDPSADGPKSFDALVAKSSKDRIEVSDIAAINATMAARSPLYRWQDLIALDRPSWLTALNESWGLFELTDDAWTSLGVEDNIAGAFSAMIGLGRRLSVVTKVLQMKRPDLIPVCDRLVLEQLGATLGTDSDPIQAAAFIAHLRREGRRNLTGLQIIQEHLKRKEGTPSLVRIFEALVWQSHPETRYPNLVPVFSEWFDR